MTCELSTTLTETFRSAQSLQSESSCLPYIPKGRYSCRQLESSAPILASFFNIINQQHEYSSYSKRAYDLLGCLLDTYTKHVSTKWSTKDIHLYINTSHLINQIIQSLDESCKRIPLLTLDIEIAKKVNLSRERILKAFDEPSQEIRDPILREILANLETTEKTPSISLEMKEEILDLKKTIKNKLEEAPL